MQEDPESLLNLAVSDQEVEHFLQWLFGPGREDEMLTELQCTVCGRRHWLPPGKEEEACTSCGGPCAATGRYQQPDMVMSAARSRGKHPPGRGIDPTEVFTLNLP